MRVDEQGNWITEEEEPQPPTPFEVRVVPQGTPPEPVPGTYGIRPGLTAEEFAHPTPPTPAEMGVAALLYPEYEAMMTPEARMQAREALFPVEGPELYTGPGPSWTTEEAREEARRRRLYGVHPEWGIEHVGPPAEVEIERQRIQNLIHDITYMHLPVGAVALPFQAVAEAIRRAREEGAPSAAAFLIPQYGEPPEETQRRWETVKRTFMPRTYGPPEAGLMGVEAYKGVAPPGSPWWRQAAGGILGAGLELAPLALGLGTTRGAALTNYAARFGLPKAVRAAVRPLGRGLGRAASRAFERDAVNLGARALGTGEELYDVTRLLAGNPETVNAFNDLFRVAARKIPGLGTREAQQLAARATASLQYESGMHWRYLGRPLGRGLEFQMPGRIDVTAQAERSFGSASAQRIQNQVNRGTAAFVRRYETDPLFGYKGLSMQEAHPIRRTIAAAVAAVEPGATEAQIGDIVEAGMRSFPLGAAKPAVSRVAREMGRAGIGQRYPGAIVTPALERTMAELGIDPQTRVGQLVQKFQLPVRREVARASQAAGEAVRAIDQRGLQFMDVYRRAAVRRWPWRQRWDHVQGS